MITVYDRVFENKGVVVTEDTEFINCTFRHIVGDVEDGIHVHGPAKAIIRNCLFDGTDDPPKSYDEAVSLIKSASVYIYDSTFLNIGKSILGGSGDNPELDHNLYLHIERCTFDGCSRRNPYIRYGKLYMKDCVIKNWGRVLNDKTHGIRIGERCQAEIINCQFIMDKFIQSGWKNFFKDWGNQFCGDMWGIDPEITSYYIPKFILNMIIHPIDAINMALPGPCKGLFVESKATATLTGCTKNRWWIRLATSGGTTKYVRPDDAI